MKNILFLIIVINFIGMLYGYYYYYEQLTSSPLWLWVFIPDCPFYVTVFTLVLILALFGFENKLLSCIGAVGMMKYGVWTLLALLVFHEYFFSESLWLLSSILFILHIGMFAEGPLLINKKLSGKHFLATLIWFLINDYFDYFHGYTNLLGEYIIGTHPLLPSKEGVVLMMVLTFALTFLMSGFAYWLSLMEFWWPAKKEVESTVKEFQKSAKTSKGRRKRRR
ncbi:MAG: DUF1405 domain-containing protein [Candidatus Micrarchaeia archaeon]